MANDTVIPIVFPNYMITVPSVPVDLPGWMNDIGVPDFKTPKQLPDLGHAGVLFIMGSSGTTKYYEYGRYDPACLGIVRNRQVPNVKVKGSTIDVASLKIVLKSISDQAGHHGAIAGAHIAVPGMYPLMLAYCLKRYKDNNNPKRAPYSLASNSCCHFMKETAEAGGVSMPSMWDPRPVSYIGEIQSWYDDLDYEPKGNALTLEGVI